MSPFPTGVSCLSCVTCRRLDTVSLAALAQEREERDPEICRDGEADLQDSLLVQSLWICYERICVPKCAGGHLLEPIRAYFIAT